ncbi:MAG: hypothetical protein R3322_15140 [Kiloniellales bacterium]|nr:hypothetical protein [Kiloniellales bacterium]
MQLAKSFAVVERERRITELESNIPTTSKFSPAPVDPIRKGPFRNRQSLLIFG